MKMRSHKLFAVVILILGVLFHAVQASAPPVQAGARPAPITGTPVDHGYPAPVTGTPCDYGYPVATPVPTAKPSPIPTILPWGTTLDTTESTTEGVVATDEVGGGESDMSHDDSRDSGTVPSPAAQLGKNDGWQEGSLPDPFKSLVDRIIQAILSALGFTV